MAERRLTDCLQQLRSRLLLIGGFTAACWAVLAALGTLCFAAWLDLLWELPPQGRVAAWWLAVLAGGVLLVWLVAKLLKRLQPGVIARQLDRAAGGSGEVVSGWELTTGRCGAVQNSDSILTAGLATIAVSSATVVAHRAKLSTAAPAKPLRVAGISLGAALVFLAVLLVALPALVATQWQRFTNPFADVPPYSAVQFQIEPGDTKVVYGQALDVRAILSGAPVERVELIVHSASTEKGKQASRVPMFPEGEGKWRATLARVAEPLAYHVAADRGRSRKFQVGVITVPNIEAARFRITPPQYTRDAPYDGPLPKQGIVALAGTKVLVRAKSNRPLAGGEVQLELGAKTEKVALQPLTKDADEVSGEFTVTATGKFTLHVTDVAGQQSQQPLIGSITLLADQRPFVRVMEPRTQSFATPTAALPVTVSAEDDYGVTTVQLYRNLNESRPLPLEFAAAPQPPRRQQKQVYLPLQQYQLQPGDVIKLFGRVNDNDPSGSKGAESSVVSVRIISQEEFERLLRVQQGLEVLTSKYQQAERRLEKLAAELDKLQKELAKEPADSPAAESLREQIQKLARDMESEAAAIAESADHELPYDLDKKLSEKLKELADKLNAAAEEAKQMAAKPGAKSGELADKLKKLGDKLRGDREQFQKEASEPLEHFAKVFPLMEDQARYVALVAAQVDLAERLAALKGKDNVDDPALKARMRDLEQEQLRNREELLDLLDSIEAHAKQLPDEEQFKDLWESALAFAGAVRDSGAAEAMSAAEAGLAEFSGTRGHEKALEAAEILKKFLSQCEGVGEEGEACLKFAPSLSNCLGNTVEQMLAEAGLGSGANSGFGQGSGNGYSARRSTLNNVGLYGGMPGRSPGEGGKGRNGQGQEGTGNFAGGATGRDPEVVDANTTGAAAGGAQGSAPLRYRQRVGQYIQRITEEVKND